MIVPSLRLHDFYRFEKAAATVGGVKIGGDWRDIKKSDFFIIRLAS